MGGADARGIPDEPHQLRFREWESPDTAHFWDSGLDRGFLGHATEWSGRAGIARASIGSTVCAIAGDSIAFSRSGDTWTIEVAWLVPDADDLDGDDDVEDEIVRQSRYVATVEACR
jgi:hypothetical protein